MWKPEIQAKFEPKTGRKTGRRNLQGRLGEGTCREALGREPARKPWGRNLQGRLGEEPHNPIFLMLNPVLLGGLPCPSDAQPYFSDAQPPSNQEETCPLLAGNEGLWFDVYTIKRFCSPCTLPKVDTNNGQTSEKPLLFPGRHFRPA